MATDERLGLPAHRGGLLPDVNSLVAAIVILGTYVTRYGMVAEGVEPGVWGLPLMLTTDFILPVLAAVWLLAVPTWSLYRRIERKNAEQ